MALRVSNVTFQALLSPTVFERFVEHDLDLLEEAFRRQIRVSNVTFQALILLAPPAESLESILAFQHDAPVILYAGDFVAVPDPITFTHQADLFGLEVINDPITFVDLAVSALHSTIVNDTLFLVDEAEVYNGVPWLGPFVIDQLDFSWQANVSYPVVASNTIVFVDSGTRTKINVTDTLTFVQTVTVGIGQTDIHQLLDFVHDVSTAGSQYTRVINDEEFIRHSLTYYTDDPCALKTYNQFDGEGDGDGIPDPRLYSPGWKLTLETMTGPKVILQLRNPETDDRDRMAFNRINRETRGGEINVYSDPDWPSVNTLLFTVVALRREKIDALHQFLYDTLGQEIKLHDWTGTTWRGVVTSPGEIATEDGVGQCGTWTISFEFEGTPYEGMAPDGPLQFSQSVGILGIFGRFGSDAIAFVSSATAHLLMVFEEEVESIMALGQDVQEDVVVEPSIATGAITGIGEIDGVGYKAPEAFGAVTGVGEIDGVGETERIGQGAVTGIGEIDGVGHREPMAQGEVEGIGEIDGVGTIESSAFGVITGIGEIDGVGVSPPVPTPQVDLYTADDTWTKPDGAVSVQVFVWGGGGGGGSGRKGAAAQAKFGGSAGGGGGCSYRFYDEAELSNTESLTVGSGGDGGASITVNSTSGSAGSAGGTSTFSSGGTLLTSTGGAAGAGGTGASVSALIAGGTGNFFPGGEGGARSSVPSERDAVKRNFWTPTGGGGGGYITAGDATQPAGVGGGGNDLNMAAYEDELPDFVAVAAAAENANGSAITSDYTVPLAGTGGGGGASSLAGNATVGGSGGNYGAGGGGGGASVNDVGNSGAGGAGAGGAVVVITYFS